MPQDLCRTNTFVLLCVVLCFLQINMYEFWNQGITGPSSVGWNTMLEIGNTDNPQQYSSDIL